MWLLRLATFVAFSSAHACPTALSDYCCRSGSYSNGHCLIPENVAKLNRSSAANACSRFPNGHLASSENVDFTLLRLRNLVIENVCYFLSQEGHYGPIESAEERYICEYVEPEKLECDCAKKFAVKSLTKAKARFRIRRSKRHVVKPLVATTSASATFKATTTPTTTTEATNATETMTKTTNSKATTTSFTTTEATATMKTTTKSTTSTATTTPTTTTKATTTTQSTTTETTTTTTCIPNWSEWSTWSKCSGDCGACHMNNRTRTCLTKETCPCSGEWIEKDYCGIMICLYPKYPCCAPHKRMKIAKRPSCGPQKNGLAIAKREFTKKDAVRSVSHGRKNRKGRRYRG
ncbi:hypothetical protein L596_020241 [Steinernema carpocapsae]|uniref:Uncharacterized protein n=1 Tax=Steinernema carpocapsae TaxID=34508 RepID=A0A4U5MT53_STECR|nr:hypothetical protein L596_020241 [Steinernema carpocapsae]